jgi:mannose-6-phosphate isomerase-like protein (cupin superfamily)
MTTITSTEQSSKIIKGRDIPEQNNRKGYDVSLQDQIGHFAVRVTTPANPFTPARHGEQRFWYILEGEAVVTIDGQTTPVGKDDLIVVAPWTDHSLRSEGRVRWICFG